MGFMDKAKKMAEQAQQKLDEAQKSFNEKQGSGGGEQGGPAVEYDAHGRPVNAPADAAPAAQPSAPPPGDPLAEPAGSPTAETPASPAAETPASPTAETPASPTPEPAKAEGDPLLADEPGSRQGADAEREAGQQPPSGPRPGMTSGDPLG